MPKASGRGIRGSLRMRGKYAKPRAQQVVRLTGRAIGIGVAAAIGGIGIGSRSLTSTARAAANTAEIIQFPTRAIWIGRAAA